MLELGERLPEIAQTVIQVPDFVEGLRDGVFRAIQNSGTYFNILFPESIRIPAGIIVTGLVTLFAVAVNAEREPFHTKVDQNREADLH